jgi:hypothetical protein
MGGRFLADTLHSLWFNFDSTKKLSDPYKRHSQGTMDYDDEEDGSDTVVVVNAANPLTEKWNSAMQHSKDILPAVGQAAKSGASTCLGTVEHIGVKASQNLGDMFGSISGPVPESLPVTTPKVCLVTTVLVRSLRASYSCTLQRVSPHFMAETRMLWVVFVPSTWAKYIQQTDEIHKWNQIDLHTFYSCVSPL